MDNYKYVLEYNQEEIINPLYIQNALKHAWKITPSKQNFMPYTVHVLHPNDKAHKQILYDKALKQQAKSSAILIETETDLREYEQTLYNDDEAPQFRNLKSAPYIFIFTQRVETKLNEMQKHNINYGLTYCQAQHSREAKAKTRDIARLEIGMFSANLATSLLNSGIDISFTQCFSGNPQKWQEKQFDFINREVLLIMTAGIGKHYRRDTLDPALDLKPEFERIVNLRK